MCGYNKLISVSLAEIKDFNKFVSVEETGNIRILDFEIIAVSSISFSSYFTIRFIDTEIFLLK